MRLPCKNLTVACAEENSIPNGTSGQKKREEKVGRREKVSRFVSAGEDESVVAEGLVVEPGAPRWTGRQSVRE